MTIMKKSPSETGTEYREDRAEYKNNADVPVKECEKESVERKSEPFGRQSKQVRGKGRLKTALQVWAALMMIPVLTLTLVSCGSSSAGSTESGTNEYYYWVMNSESDALVRENYSGNADSGTALLDGLIASLYSKPSDDVEPLLTDEVTIKSEELDSGILKLDFSSGYDDLSDTHEVLVRAGVVRTLVQVDGVSGVSFTVEGKEAVTPGGVTLGVMNADSFVEDAGRQINAIASETIRLYYADESGKKLRTEGRLIYYSASKPLEWAIVERVIAGPKETGNYPTVPSNTQIISVTSSNKVCYVNLSSSFLDTSLTLDPSLTIYSIVNSLVDNCREIDEVQISIEGDSSVSYRDAVDLSQPLMADYNLVESTESTESTGSTASS